MMLPDGLWLLPPSAVPEGIHGPEAGHRAAPVCVDGSGRIPSSACGHKAPVGDPDEFLEEVCQVGMMLCFTQMRNYFFLGLFLALAPFIARGKLFSCPACLFLSCWQRMLVCIRINQGNV